MKRIIQIISNKEWGGGEQYAYDLSEHLKADNYPVILVCKPCPPVVDQLKRLGLPLAVLPLKGMVDVWSSWRLSRMVGKDDVIIHVHNFRDAMTAVLARVFSANRQHIKIVVTRHLVKKGKNNIVYKWLYKQTDCIVFVSELARKEFFKGNPSVEQEKTCVILNSIQERSDNGEVDVRKEFGIANHTTVITFFGRLSKEKGLSFLIEALQLVRTKDYKLLIFGTGDESYKTELQKQITSSGLSDHVIFAGFRPLVLPYIRQCDFGVVPSLVPESFSLNCLEYMSQAKCVITTNHGGQTEYIVNGKNGILVPPFDCRQLAERIDQLCEDQHLCRQLGEQARHDYEAHLSYEHFYRKMTDVYCKNRTKFNS